MIRQFDVLDNPSSQSRAIAPFVAVIQSHLYDEGPTVLVAPLLRMPITALLTKVTIPVVHQGESFVLMLSEMAALDRRVLSVARGSLADREDDIRRALDRLFTGF
ncbi:CcdB family protein [Brevundimonas sp. VNH65]|uniref:CcdB family protein n=1 Tax=Brevundimonas sp. VNH65 TaxID=3400917 RepID=UPI003C0644F5